METAQQSSLAVAHFMRLVAQVHDGARHLLHPEDAVSVEAASASVNLPHDAHDVSQRVVAAMSSLDAVPFLSDRQSAFIRACRKVGQDLVVHLDRFESLGSDQTEAAIKTPASSILWPQADVDALGQRLRDMIQEWTELSPGMK